MRRFLAVLVALALLANAVAGMAEAHAAAAGDAPVLAQAHHDEAGDCATSADCHSCAHLLAPVLLRDSTTVPALRAGNTPPVAAAAPYASHICEPAGEPPR
jgi:hypothetical protein